MSHGTWSQKDTLRSTRPIRTASQEIPPDAQRPGESHVTYIALTHRKEKNILIILMKYDINIHQWSMYRQPPNPAPQTEAGHIFPVVREEGRVPPSTRTARPHAGGGGGGAHAAQSDQRALQKLKTQERRNKIASICKWWGSSWKTQENQQ